MKRCNVHGVTTVPQCFCFFLQNGLMVGHSRVSYATNLCWKNQGVCLSSGQTIVCFAAYTHKNYARMTYHGAFSVDHLCLRSSLQNFSATGLSLQINWSATGSTQSCLWCLGSTHKQLTLLTSFSV